MPVHVCMHTLYVDVYNMYTLCMCVCMHVPACVCMFACICVPGCMYACVRVCAEFSPAKLEHSVPLYILSQYRVLCLPIAAIYIPYIHREHHAFHFYNTVRSVQLFPTHK